MSYQEQENKRKELELKEKQQFNKTIFKWVRGSILGLSILVIGSMYGCPKYSVYQQTMEGKAEYEKAVQNRKIKVEEAKAENEAAISKAQAKIKMAHAHNESNIIKAEGQRCADSIRAIGIARANEIIGESLKGNTDYLHFLWIDQLKEGGQKVYIPTESNLPILEAKK